MICKRSGRAILGLMAVIFVAGVSVRGQKVVTVADNVSTVLTHEQQSLVNSYDVVRVTKDDVFAFPRQKPNGTYDHGLWDFVRGPHGSGKSKWLHDNSLLSWLAKHGTHSYRIKGRWSLHIEFFCNGKYPGGMLIKMHIDRFAPGWGSPVDSARHFLQEQIPDLLGGGEHDQREIELKLRQRYKLEMPQSDTNATQ